MKIFQNGTTLLALSLVAGFTYAQSDDLSEPINALKEEIHEQQRASRKSYNESIGYSGLRDLEERVRKLEANQSQAITRLPRWLDKFRLSGNADVAYFNGQDNSHSPDSRFAVDNARLFFDFDISDKASFYFEWDIVREFSVKSDPGQLYLRLDRLFENDAINLKLGSFPIPFGEEYVRFHEQRFENPLISFSAPAPYNWDEGIELFGTTFDNKLGYILAVTDGDDSFNGNTNEVVQVAGKISYTPDTWVRIAISAVDTGTLGTTTDAGESALEFGGSHAYPFGAGTGVVNYKDGMEIDDDPSNKFSMRAWEIDTTFYPGDWGKLWLAYGQATIQSNGSSVYDRDLLYWISEGVLELEKFSRYLSKYYLAVRYSAIGTFDSGEGYMLAAMNDGKELGYNTQSVHVISGGIGMRLDDNITLKAEYSWYDFNLVKGVAAGIRDIADNRNLVAFGVFVQF